MFRLSMTLKGSVIGDRVWKIKLNGKALLRTTSQSLLRNASSPSRGASGEEIKFAKFLVREIVRGTAC